MGNLIILFILIVIVSIFGASILYKFVQWINKPAKTGGINTIIPVYSTSTDIEQQVRFHCIGHNIDHIILLNLGANPDAEYVCKLLSRQNDFIFYCSSLDEIGVALDCN